MKYKTLILIVILFLQSCCYIKNGAPTPKIETPKGYDQIKSITLSDYAYYNVLGRKICNYESDRTVAVGLELISASNSTFDENCWRNELPSVDWSHYDAVRCFMGATSYTVYAAMNYKVFISHEKKEILIKSTVTRSGACGSDNEDYSWTKVLKIPKVPKGYIIRVERDLPD